MRTIAFSFPLILYSISIIYEHYGDQDRRISKIINILLFLNVLTPAVFFYVVPIDWLNRNPLEWLQPVLPLPINIWRWFTSPNGHVTW